MLKLFRDSADRKHELTILQMQIEQQERGHVNRLEEIQITSDSLESRALYKTYNVGIKWVDALNGTVRPILAYSFSCYILQLNMHKSPYCLIMQVCWRHCL